MKKLVSVIFAICLMATLSVTAFAADTEINQGTTDKAGGMQLGFTVDPTYIVTIPATIELDKTTDEGVATYEKDYTISANGVRLKEDEILEVKITSDFNLKTSEDAQYSLPYTVVKQGETNAIANNGVVATFDTNNEEQTQALHFAAENPTYAGEFMDTVTFTVAVA